MPRLCTAKTIGRYNLHIWQAHAADALVYDYVIYLVRLGKRVILRSNLCRN